MTEDRLQGWIEDRLAGEEPTDEPEDEVVEVSGDSGDEAEDASAGEAFWSALTPAQRERAEGDQEYLDQLISQYNASLEGDPEETDEDEVEGDDADVPMPQTADEVVQYAYDHEDDLLGSGWASVEEFLITAASDAKWWLEASAEMGVPANARPSGRNLPEHLQMHLLAAEVGLGAKVVPDRVRLRPPKPHW